MSKTVKEWEANFATLGDRQQHQIVDALITLADWPLFKHQYKEHGLGELGVYLYKIAYGSHPSVKLIDRLMKTAQTCTGCKGTGKTKMYTDPNDSATEPCEVCRGLGFFD